MKKSYFLIVFACLVLLANCKKKEENKPLNPALKFVELAPDNNNNRVFDMVRQPNGDFTLLGYSYYGSPKNYDVYFTDITFDGEQPVVKVENKIFQGALKPSGSIKLLKAGGYISAVTYGSSNTNSYLKFIKGQNAVNISNNYSAPQNPFVYFLGIKEISNGYLLYGSDEDSCIVRRLDANYTLLWEKRFGGIYRDFIADVEELADGSIGVFANTESFSRFKNDIWYLKLSSEGDSISSMFYGVPSNSSDEISGIYKEGNLFYVMAVRYPLGGLKDSKSVLICIEENGTVVWEKDLGKEKIFNCMASTKNGFVLGGFTNFITFEPGDFYVQGIDKAGNNLWQKVYGDEKLSEFSMKILTDDENFYLLGNRQDGVETKGIFIKDKLGN